MADDEKALRQAQEDLIELTRYACRGDKLDDQLRVEILAAWREARRTITELKAKAAAAQKAKHEPLVDEAITEAE